jgi:glycosyltransferase involved in cell wall biosynthesis
MIDISVVIPTYNRCSTLLRCLQALEQQTLDRARYEIIVVDDGSTDETVRAMNEQPSVRFFQQPQNAGPAAARNVGIRAAVGTYVLFLGDDIIARPQVLEQHMKAHAQAPGQHIAILGYAPWAQDQEITPLMRYLFEGHDFRFRQFQYDAIVDPDNVTFGFFYTCNLSLNREFLLGNGLFDEDFPYAYGEDTELAYRLQCHGLRMLFRCEIVADHEHPTSYRSARRRAHIAGEIGLLIAKKHPDLVDILFLNYGMPARLNIWLKRQLIQAIIDPLLALTDQQRWDHSLLARLYDWALRSHQFWGLLEAATTDDSVRRALNSTASKA